MGISFGEALRRLRIEKGISQQQLADLLFVDRSSVSRWEGGLRVPDAEMVTQLSVCLEADIQQLLHSAKSNLDRPNIIMLDDEPIILSGGMPILTEAFPNARVTGFTRPADALGFAGKNKVSLAFLDIEMGRVSGLDVCRKLLKQDFRTNVIYLTAYREYSFDAWESGASGFLLKPLSVDAVRRQLPLLRNPVSGLDGS